jgi:hypothetical protein
LLKKRQRNESEYLQYIESKILIMAMQLELAFYCFVIILAIIMIANTQRYEQKFLRSRHFTTQERIAFPICRQTVAVNEIKNGILLFPIR